MIATYTVSLLDPHTKYFHVTLRLSGVDTATLVLKFPAWSPGSYKIRDYAKNLSHFSVKSSDGTPLAWTKQAKARWAIETDGRREIEISYRIYGAELNVQGIYLDNRFGFWNGPALFFYADAMMNTPIDLHLRLPRRWTAATGLRRIAKNHYRARDMDELYDCPVQAGANQTIHRFRVAGRSHRAAFVGKALKPLPEIVKDMKRIVQTEVRLFGKAPYRDYTFLVQFMPDLYGGLEHRNSSTNLFDGALLRDKDKYTEFLALISHEFFHTWNVKRIRPVALGPFDYSKETYTRELWVAEGITSYYDDHVLVRSGLIKRDAYFAKVLTKTIERYENQPAKSLMSLAESSFDAWIKLYQPTENSPNTVMSYYLKGGLVAMLLDMQMIRLSHGRKNLDDLMRLLWKRYLKRPQTGMTRSEFDATLSQVMGSEALKRFLRDYVDGVKPIVWRQFLKPFGIVLKPKKDKLPPYLGVSVAEQNGRVYVEKVAEGSPAFQSPLQPGDELLAFDNYRLTKEKAFTEIVGAQTVGSEHRLLFARRAQVEETLVTLSPNPEFAYEIASAPKLKKSEKYLQDCFFRKHT